MCVSEIRPIQAITRSSGKVGGKKTEIDKEDNPIKGAKAVANAFQG
jgi:hypothetical protein